LSSRMKTMSTLRSSFRFEISIPGVFIFGESGAGRYSPPLS
jgi:hypothetical protein